MATWTWVLGLALAGEGLGIEGPDPQVVLQEARKLAEAGEYEKALEKHLWIHDHSLKDNPSFYGVRLSFALVDWVALGEKYPKAREALVAVRDKKAKALVEGKEKGERESAHDVVSINGYLKEGEKSIALFKKVRESRPESAKTIYPLFEDQLVAAREYEVCSEQVPDPVARIQEETKKRLDYLNEAKATPQMRSYAERAYLKGASQLVEVLVGSGRVEEAAKVEGAAIKVRDDEAMRAGLKSARDRGEFPRP